jgi:hypothetical protein
MGLAMRVVALMMFFGALVAADSVHAAKAKAVEKKPALLVEPVAPTPKVEEPVVEPLELVPIAKPMISSAPVEVSRPAPERASAWWLGVHAGVFGGVTVPFGVGPVVDFELGWLKHLSRVWVGGVLNPFAAFTFASSDRAAGYVVGASLLLTLAIDAGPGWVRIGAGSGVAGMRGGEHSPGRDRLTGGTRPLGAFALGYDLFLGEARAHGVSLALHYLLMPFRDDVPPLSHDVSGRVGYVYRW